MIIFLAATPIQTFISTYTAFCKSLRMYARSSSVRGKQYNSESFFSDTIKKKKTFQKKKIGMSIEKAVGPIACQCSIEILDCFY